jgi:hypothetical protein
MKFRQHKPEDETNTRRALTMIDHLIKSHPDIDGNQWMDAIVNLMVGTLATSQVSYSAVEEFLEVVKMIYKCKLEALKLGSPTQDECTQK